MLVCQLTPYLLITGLFFAAGVVFDGREDIRVAYGQDTNLALWTRFAVVAAGVWALSVVAIFLQARWWTRERQRADPLVKTTPDEQAR